HELFLCDYKVYMLLKKLLGKPFYTAKKFPVPIKIDYTNKENIKEEITSHVEGSTHFYMGHGPNYTVKIGRSTLAKEELTQNIVDGITNTIPHILKWSVSAKK